MLGAVAKMQRADVIVHFKYPKGLDFTVQMEAMLKVLYIKSKG